jgi:ubiquitin-protein ligase
MFHASIPSEVEFFFVGESNPKHVHVFLLGEFYSILQGPTNTPYADGAFVLDLLFPTNYPFVAPTSRLDTVVPHPNVRLNLC